jgi:S1-C subfamily serine protease
VCAAFPAHTESMSEAAEFDLQSYSAAISGLVEKAGAQVAAIKSAPYRITSGVIFSENLIAVNNHLLKREGKIPVRLPAGDDAEADIIGRDPALDLAILQVPSAKWSGAQAEEDSALRAGALAVVVGRTLDAGLSASVGILGAVGGPRRSWRGGELERFLRLDVNLYPSQAGAAVVSASGRFIGMATAAILRHSALAVPMGTLHSVAHELLTQGGIRQGYLGVGLQPVGIPQHLQNKTSLAGETGLMIVSIEPGTSAEKAGLQLGDILLAAGQTSLTEVETMMGALRGTAIGKPLLFTIVRAGEVTTVEIEIALRPGRKN